MNIKKLLFLGLFQGLVAYAYAQNDTLKTLDLKEFQLRDFRDLSPIAPLSNVNRNFLIGGRKTESIQISQLPANLSEKTGRQLFAKIPGGFIYDMDGSGNQINLSVRGLDGHRSWEFNVRQNGVMINTDIYGYPASHYSMPIEAVEKIELIRGTGALQYGQQFGGMLNYILKEPDSTKKFSFENLSTVGSFGLLSTFNAIGGKVGKLTYYAYYQKRVSDGYRDNSNSSSNAQHIDLTYQFSDRLKLRGELSRNTYLYQIPGPLTDKMFVEDPKQSTRSRNYYSPEIWIPALILDYHLSPRTSLNWTVSGVFGQRSSVTFDGFANKPDIIDTATGEYAPRNVDIDNYHTRTTEGRLIHNFQLGNMKSNFSANFRYFNNSMDRRQRGQGTTGTDYDITLQGDFQRDMNLTSESFALALENQFYLTDQLSITPGLRVEMGSSQMIGRIDYIEDANVPQTIDYDFVALGINANYQLNSYSRLYAGISQANRPVIFQDIIPGNPLTLISDDLEDSFGYNAEAGWENSAIPGLKYNITLFRTYIGNRLGNIFVEQDGQTYIQKTNIGNSLNNGIEFYLDYELLKGKNWGLNFYTSTSFMDAKYTSGEVTGAEGNQDITGNRIEAAPKWLSRNGLSGHFKVLQILLQHQFLADTYADALNTKTSPETGAVGIVPSYNVWDLNTSYQVTSNFVVRAGVNNLLNESYFTKRPQMYPGPGIWTSDARSFVVSIGFKL
ncbi:TonB-dependent receptor family protein [Algoriphagus persicinus]|uniref:TonB-dependent receptor family protein n=1 Tax=Algoriphagus persicinus TaxID=3108754 RepID=UPI002B385BAE|nr:TonB-dependent receptor [Algoriphagus sp. E1-3-M2]MEB2783897.1 TonB-dependent receptor [Algoriphagus sp. E1-3-M2]